MINKNDFEWIEEYLAGTLNEEEKNIFEQRLREEPKLATELHSQRLLLDSFKVYGKRKQLKNQLDVFHEEILEENKGKRLVPHKYAIKAFWKKHLPTMAVAASVAIITVFGTLFTADYIRSLENRQFNYYRELKKDLDNIKKTQRSIFNAAVESAPEIRPVRYSATGFLIASNGYVVTNHHVVEGADSIFVESRTNDPRLYKVKEVYSDAKSDLSILKIVDESFTAYARMPYTFKIREADLGEPVYTLAFPREDMVYGEGSISSRTGFEGDTTAYQISIPVNPGNSGGPLLDDKGNLIGIITGKNTAVEGAAFAIKSKYLISLIDSIPSDSLTEPLMLSGKNSIKDMKRPEQIKQLEDLVFNVKVYQKR